LKLRISDFGGNPKSGLGVSGYERFGVLEKQQLIVLQKHARYFEQQHMK
jgi:hypothetical protein